MAKTKKQRSFRKALNRRDGKAVDMTKYFEGMTINPYYGLARHYGFVLSCHTTNRGNRKVTATPIKPIISTTQSEE